MDKKKIIISQKVPFFCSKCTKNVHHAFRRFYYFDSAVMYVIKYFRTDILITSILRRRGVAVFQPQITQFLKKITY